MSSNEDVKKQLPTAPDAPRLDGFEGFTDEVEGDEEQTGRVIQGTLIKFTNEATWETGDGKELSSDLELIVVNVARVVQKWKDGAPVETIVLAPGQKFPDVKKLNEAVPQKEWEEGPDGKPRGPWQAQYIVYMIDLQKTMQRYTWPTGTTGGGIAVRDFVDKVNFMRMYRGEHVYGVITLGDVFMNTRFGGRQRPHLNLVRWWKKRDDGDKALPASDPPKLEGPQEVKPPSAKEVLDDSIPF